MERVFRPWLTSLAIFAIATTNTTAELQDSPYSSFTPLCTDIRSRNIMLRELNLARSEVKVFFVSSKLSQ